MFNITGAKLTNQRPAKDGMDTAFIKVSCSKGLIELSPKATVALKVMANDYIGFQPATDDEGNEFIAIYKGQKGDGQKMGENLTLSAANAWIEMGGNTKENIIFALDTDSSLEVEGTVYYKLTKLRVEPKQTRTRKAKEEIND
jgi:hypothetical protein